MTRVPAVGVIVSVRFGALPDVETASVAALAAEAGSSVRTAARTSGTAYFIPGDARLSGRSPQVKLEKCIDALYSVTIEDLAAQLERRIALITHVLRGQAHRGRSVGALLTLRRLDDRGPMRITDLAAAERVTQPTMTTLVARLAQEGLVSKTRDAADARAVLVELTDAGRAQLLQVRPRRPPPPHPRLDHLDDDARSALVAALPALDQLLST